MKTLRFVLQLMDRNLISIAILRCNNWQGSATIKNKPFRMRFAHEYT